MTKRNIKSVTVRAEVDGSGHITGYASTFTREPDWVGDVVAKGAFAECLERIKADGTVLPLLYNHDQSLDSFIGRVTSIEEDEHGLLFSADFDETESAQRARQLAMDGRLAKFSFAYEILEQEKVELDDGRTANELRKLNVSEVSLVLDPCNPDTSVVEVKGRDEGEGESVGTVYIDVVPRVSDDDAIATQIMKVVFSMAGKGTEEHMAKHKKSGRRNSKADEDAIRQAIALLQGVLGEMADGEPDADEPDEAGANTKAEPDDEDEVNADAPDDGDQNDTDEDEGSATPKGRETEWALLDAYKKALLCAYGVVSKERSHGDGATFR